LTTSRAPLPTTDAGLAPASAHFAADALRLAAHAAGQASDELRFYRMTPAIVVGRHQRVFHEVRLDYCAAHGIEVLRRLTGGGTLYHDPDQLAFSLVCAAGEVGLADALMQLCEGLAAGLRTLGLPVVFRAPNDLEVDGRKLASGFVTRRGDTLLFHGGLLLEVDIERALSALRLPTEKLSPRGLAGARQRLVTVRELLGAVPPLAEVRAAMAEGLTAALGRTALSVVDVPPPAPIADTCPIDHWPSGAEALWKTGGGLLRATLAFDASGERVVAAGLGGDVVVDPPESFDDLEDWLRGALVVDLPTQVERFFADRSVELLGFTLADVVHVVGLATARLAQCSIFGLDARQANRLMVLTPSDGFGAAKTLGRASIMLVPYCAKPAWCAWRSRDGCAECGGCEVGDAYALARERGMAVVSITNYDHLCRTLAEMRATGVEAYVGMCCEQFFIKRHQTFQAAGIPAVLMDIAGANCYELRQEEQAYAGTFTAEAHLDLPLVEKVMAHIPLRSAPLDQDV
jgi:lipoate-protein ligase A